MEYKNWEYLIKIVDSNKLEDINEFVVDVVLNIAQRCDAELGAQISIISGYRSNAKQLNMFLAGDTTATGSQSSHNYNSAVDIGIDNGKTKYRGYKNIPLSTVNTATNSSLLTPDTLFGVKFLKIIKEECEKSNGNVKWGGLFSNNYDPNHIEYTFWRDDKKQDKFKSSSTGSWLSPQDENNNQAEDNRLNYVDITAFSDGTLQELLDSYNVEMTVEEVLNFNPNDNTDNRERIYKFYNTEDKFTYPDKSSINGDLVKSQTVIAIPISKLDREFILKEGTRLYPNDNFNSFLSEEIKRVVNNPGYENMNRFAGSASLGIGKEINNSKFYKQSTAYTVMIWCRTLGENGQLLNITPYVNMINTNVDLGGNFQLSLAPLIGEYVDGKLEIKAKSLIEYKYHDTNKTKFVSKGSLYYNSGFTTKIDNNNVINSQLRRNEFYFHNLIQQNDMVFIKFEKMHMEPEIIGEEFIIDRKTISGQVFDLIGLVDTNTVMFDSQSSNVNISVNGRDLSKLLMEDGVYFFPLQYTSQTENIFRNTDSASKSITRLNDGSIFDIWNAYYQKDIATCLQYILNQLCTIQVVPDMLFDGYPQEDLVRFFIEKTDKAQFQRVEAAGIWKIFKLIVDESLKNRVIVDSSISTYSGDLFSLVGKVAQPLFTEVIMDTYGDKYYLIVRKPPFTWDSFKTNKTINIPEGRVLGDTLGFDNSSIYTWYRLTPNGVFAGGAQQLTWAYARPVYLNEYAEIWGSRPLDVTTNYIDYSSIKDSQDRQDLKIDYFKKQTDDDLAFLIESNCYLPFTRRGVIAIQGGDRRIKRGMNVYLESTDEMFYVDGVSNSVSISQQGIPERTTTVNVSRGIKMKYYDLYFNIVNFDKNQDIYESSPLLRALSNKKREQFTLNKNVLQFFLNRKQFQ